ncbi:cyclopropane-fatty-acyl-phospholipid synthase family protein [Streptomyces sp. NPDC005438]|uniref:cyclopropane-fatty-acyl-phospholipid synthase family protein n=1 Tax=Streptomyces sp. NPDC005438 TaxID=3156880 RepID=UPI0033A96B68
MKPIAPRLEPLLRQLFDGPPPFRLRAWDGSHTGPPDGVTVVLRTPRALRRLLWQPGEVGLAQAYASGDLDVEGDAGTGLREGLRTLWRSARERALTPPRMGVTDRARAATLLVRLGAAGPRPADPGAPRARQRGPLHSTDRDRAAISHHYDLSNDFYTLLLDPTMAYSCAYWTRPPSADYQLADAQRDKLRLICRKLRLREGDRLLDLGCGWGSLTLYAAAEYGARVTAVTLSAEQAAHVRARVREERLEDRVEVRLCHYRELADGGFDAVATVEMGEHVGEEYPHFARTLHAMLRPRGRLLVQQMSRGPHAAPGGGPFIETFIAPDMRMRPLGATVALLEDAGLEVRATESLREDYVHTVHAWHRTLEERWDKVVSLVGEETARVWRLYLVGGALAFEQRRMGVDQILARRPTPDGDDGPPPRPADWYGDHRD